jgi:phenylacetate-CoA ligase
MNVRSQLYFSLVQLRGQCLGQTYARFAAEEREGIPPDATRRQLIRLLAHCQRSVPFYARIMREQGDFFYDDPEEYLRRLPILTKRSIRSHFDELLSADLPRRHWYYNATSGSTGEPLRFVQDREYAAHAGAISLLYSHLVGREVGESAVYLWGSPQDIAGGSEGWRAHLVSGLTNTTMLSVARLGPEQMREQLGLLNARRPKLIVAYAAALYELARFAEREGCAVARQAAIVVSAGTLYPFMRETIERVFQCRVFNRYGSREVGDIACERPDSAGLWVAPWGNYVEIVDDSGVRVPDGTSGDILVTSLSNFAMPFLRYRIEDRGALLPRRDDGQRPVGQVLETVLGRSHDMFINRKGAPVEGLLYAILLYSRAWIARFQVIQSDASSILIRIVTAAPGPQPTELEEIAARTRVIMDDDVAVRFEFVDEIPTSASGKHRFIIREMGAA